MTQSIHEDEYSKIELRNDGIVIGEFKAVDIDIETAQQVVKNRVAVCGEKPRPILIDMRNVKSVTKEARDYLASEDGSRMLVATALFVESSFSSFIANSFVRINFIRPLLPLKVFSSKDRTKAMEWLKEYL